VRGQGFITQELHQTWSEKKREKENKISSHGCLLVTLQGSIERWSTIGSNFQCISFYNSEFALPEDSQKKPQTMTRIFYNTNNKMIAGMNALRALIQTGAN
jgi:hypothetical protein